MTRGRVGRLRLAVRGAAVAAASIVLAVAAVLATASVTARPVLFLAAGLLAGVGSGVAGARWAVRHVAGPGRRSLAAAVAGAAVLAVVGVGFAVAVPSSAEGRPAPVAGERFWQLPTGTRARYVEIPARGPRRPTPVVFVHGGPGTPDMPGDSGFFGRLADDGFDVYVYDQVGAGGSTRLADPEQHGLGRDVADLEAIRIAIGAQRMVLVGHSYGARVVAGYLAAHPGRVVRAVFSSPLSLDPADSSGGGIRRRLTGPQQAALYARLLRPRNLLVYGLLQVNPRAAHALAGDGEMDAGTTRFTRLLSRGSTVPATPRLTRRLGSASTACSTPSPLALPATPTCGPLSGMTARRRWW